MHFPRHAEIMKTIMTQNTTQYFNGVVDIQCEVYRGSMRDTHS